MGTYSNIRDQQYRTELVIRTSDIGLKRAESDIIWEIGINFYPISDFQTVSVQHGGWEVRCLPLKKRALGLNPANVYYIFWILDIGMDSYVDIGALPILEWQFSAHCIFFRYWNGSLQSHIFSSDIGITDVNVGCRISLTLRSMSMPTYGIQ